MSRFSPLYLSSFLAVLVLVSFPLSQSHTWFNCAKLKDPNDRNSECQGFTRGYVGSPSGYVMEDHYVNKVLNWDNNAPVCSKAQSNKLFYNPNFPRPRVQAGETASTTYNSNGHVNKDNPLTNSTHAFYWTGDPNKQLTRMGELTPNNRLSSLQNYDDCLCGEAGFYGVGPWFPKRGDNGNNVVCQAFYTIPPNTPSGIYQIVWQWTYDKHFNAPTPDNKEVYTQCFDVIVTGPDCQTPEDLPYTFTTTELTNDDINGPTYPSTSSDSSNGFVTTDAPVYPKTVGEDEHPVGWVGLQSQAYGLNSAFYPNQAEICWDKSYGQIPYSLPGKVQQPPTTCTARGATTPVTTTTTPTTSSSTTASSSSPTSPTTDSSNDIDSQDKTDASSTGSTNSKPNNAASSSASSAIEPKFGFDAINTEAQFIPQVFDQPTIKEAQSDPTAVSTLSGAYDGMLFPQCSVDEPQHVDELNKAADVTMAPAAKPLPNCTIQDSGAFTWVTEKPAFSESQCNSSSILGLDNITAFALPHSVGVQAQHSFFIPIYYNVSAFRSIIADVCETDLSKCYAAGQQTVAPGEGVVYLKLDWYVQAPVSGDLALSVWLVPQAAVLGAARPQDYRLDWKLYHIATNDGDNDSDTQCQNVIAETALNRTLLLPRQFPKQAASNTANVMFVQYTTANQSVIEMSLCKSDDLTSCVAKDQKLVNATVGAVVEFDLWVGQCQANQQYVWSIRAVDAVQRSQTLAWSVYEANCGVSVEDLRTDNCPLATRQLRCSDEMYVAKKLLQEVRPSNTAAAPVIIPPVVVPNIPVTGIVAQVTSGQATQQQNIKQSSTASDQQDENQSNASASTSSADSNAIPMISIRSNSPTANQRNNNDDEQSSTATQQSSTATAQQQQQQNASTAPANDSNQQVSSAQSSGSAQSASVSASTVIASSAAAQVNTLTNDAQSGATVLATSSAQDSTSTTSATATPFSMLQQHVQQSTQQQNAVFSSSTTATTDKIQQSTQNAVFTTSTATTSTDETSSKQSDLSQSQQQSSSPFVSAATATQRQLLAVDASIAVTNQLSLLTVVAVVMTLLLL